MSLLPTKTEPTKKTGPTRVVLMRPSRHITLKVCCDTCAFHKREVVGDEWFAYHIEKCALGNPDQDVKDLPKIQNEYQYYCDSWLPSQPFVVDACNKPLSKQEADNGDNN